MDIPFRSLSSVPVVKERFHYATYNNPDRKVLDEFDITRDQLPVYLTLYDKSSYEENVGGTNTN